MDEYILKNDVLKLLSRNSISKAISFSDGVSVYDSVQNIPTADVVPISEVRKILAEFDGIIDLLNHMTGLQIIVGGKYDELRKKYMDEKNGGKAEENIKKQFTPEDVRKMSQSEVRENYQAILDSMKTWH